MSVESAQSAPAAQAQPQARVFAEPFVPDAPDAAAHPNDILVAPPARVPVRPERDAWSAKRMEEIRPWLKSKGLSAGARRTVIYAFSRYESQAKGMFTGQGRLADELRVNIKTVNRHLMEAREKGLIVFEETRRPPGRKVGGRSTNRYWLNDDLLSTKKTDVVANVVANVVAEVLTNVETPSGGKERSARESSSSFGLRPLSESTSFAGTTTTSLREDQRTGVRGNVLATPLPAGMAQVPVTPYRPPSQVVPDPIAEQYTPELAARIRARGLDPAQIVNGVCRKCGTPLFETSGCGICWEHTQTVFDHISGGGQITEKMRAYRNAETTRKREAEARREQEREAARKAADANRIPWD